ncbi:metallophosphoesterase family protein [Microbulbifer elongatus]|uniref:Metallophosphoesterase family protein n=1 Tax=Microbulbifer elongatus TaxID=86173 RepID=A0ABT1P3N3_9GAMM|nr:metallophosphoesterase family protein [Microbulbifer elongatus]MCQ3829714.1 metallophosphoesterase family protein [Microbulbifer elongatus]
MRLFSNLIVALLLLCSTVAVAADSPDNVHDELEKRVSHIIDRMSRALSPAERIALTPESVVDFLTADERRYLGTAFSRFEVDRNAVIYVAFDASYGETPFWLVDQQFTRRGELDFIVDEEDPYHVWSKAVPAGEVRLGVPSLSGELKPYLVFAAPAHGRSAVSITPLTPAVDVEIAEIGGRPFIDDNDYFNTLPSTLAGLPVLRSFESWELVSRFVGYFRETRYPSSARPDHLQLTWQGDPATSATVQWRTDDSVDQGLLWVAPKADVLARGAKGAMRKKSSFSELRTRQVVNDPVVRLHRVALEGLKPATDYLYAVSTDNGKHWTEPREFRTAAATPSEPFSFVYLGDPQNGLDRWGQLIRQADFEFPHARFYMIAGDLIDHGQEQDNWDQFFHEGSSVFDRSMVVPALGNHDSHGGHPTLYLRQFALPDNGSSKLDPGRTYHVTYQDLLVVVMDSNYHLVEPELQVDWLDRVLGESDARWKVVIYHHPFYASREGRDNKSIRDTWGPIFDKHNVDIAFQGHDHAYMRTVPMRGNEPVAEGEQGTIYLVAVSGTKMYEQELPEFAAFGAVNTRTYQVIDVDPQSGSLEYRAISDQGKVIDQFSLMKPAGAVQANR